ncbi:MAG: hypothetical protein ABSA79_01250 [Candidatus Bathyarchaeia archaeon]|jgi:uncharacterized coiled-coil DUF342 family protein
MSNEQKTVRIEDIHQQIEKLKEQANTANAQITKHIEQRDQLNELVKKTHQEINELKTERDSLNEKVKLLKQQRDIIRAKASPIIEQINARKERIAEYKKKLPRERQQDLQQEFEAIEWKIQTTSLDLQEEKRLIENVKQLETLLSAYKKIDAQNKKIKDLIIQRKAIEDEADVFHNELTELAKKSQDLHSKMIEKVNAAKISRAQADGLHQAYIKTKEDIVQMYVKIAELTGQLRALRTAMYEEEKLRRMAAQLAYREKEKAYKERENAAKEQQQVVKEKQQAIKEKLGAEAKEKLKRGEKLSWNEFQLALGDEPEEDPETKNSS